MMRSNALSSLVHFSRPRRVAHRALLLVSAAALAAGGCSRDLEEVPDAFQPSNAHAAYRHGLIEADLAATALGRDWIEASEAALREPAQVSAPFQESGYFGATTANAVGYAFAVRRGQRIEAELEVDAPGALRIFMDLFRLVDDDPRAPVHVASGATSVGPLDGARAAPVTAPDSVRRLRLEPLRDGTYVLRVQPELLRSARFSLRITVDASLSFPVAGVSERAIWSAFGADREGGRRSHRGIDIFAPRGTPVLSASDGMVSRVDTTAVGGNVVWVNDATRNMRLYYAHLDSHSVQQGQRVEAGDQLGTVGNTGNAITTPPHLHFGVYARGAVDPYPFLARARTTPQEISADATRLGSWSRTTASAADVLAGPDSGAAVLASLELNTPVLVWGASAHWYRVLLPDGRSGYVAAGATEPATPLRHEALADPAHVFDRPGTLGAVIEELERGAEVPVLGSFGVFLYVQTPAGLNGWLSLE